MKLSRLFLLSIFLCFLVSGLSAYAMVRFVLGHMDSYSTSVSDTLTKPQDNGPTEVSPKLSDLESGVKAVAKKVSPSVVSIVISKEVQTYKTDPFGFFYEPAGTVKKTVGGGTGFFISKDGYILTNKHVVGDPNAQYSVILSDGTELIGKVLAFDPTTDLAIIRAYKDKVTPYSDAQPVRFVDDTTKIEVGSFVVAIGNALAQFQNTLTLGVVSGLGRQIEAGDQLAETTEVLSGLIQTDTAINPGNSGGPLVNLAGEVVGINTAISQGANGIGFAIPLSGRIVDSIRRSVEQYGVIKRSFVGVRYSLLTPEIAKTLNIPVDHGALVSSTNGPAVVPGSPAEKAGLDAGDVVLEVDGTVLSGGVGLKETLAEKLPNDTVQLKVWKKKTGKIEIVKLTLGESPTGQ